MDFDIQSFLEEYREKLLIALIAFFAGGITSIALSAVAWHMPSVAYFSLDAVGGNLPAEILFTLVAIGIGYLFLAERLRQ